jgi:hypothetical protein
LGHQGSWFLKRVLCLALLIIPKISLGDDSVIISPAYPGVHFNSPETLDWRALAPKKYDEPSPALLNNLVQNLDTFNNAEIKYEVSTPAQFKKWHHYFISEDGIVELKVTGLEGTVRFRFDEGKKFQGRDDFGSITGTEVHPIIAGGGFVISSLSSLTFSTHPLKIEFNQLKESSAQDNSLRELDVSSRCWKTINSFGFKASNNQTYGFIRYSTDGAECKGMPCSHKYLLVDPSKKMKIIKWNNYDCDI